MHIAASDTMGGPLTFKRNDPVVHPVRGAGVVEGIEEQEWLGSRTPYYRIALIEPRGTDFWIPVSAAEEAGLRCAISPSELDQVWCVLRDDPEPLSDNHKRGRPVISSSPGTVRQMKRHPQGCLSGGARRAKPPTVGL